VPVAPSYRITDVARAIAPDARHAIIGLRPGEKPHELLVSQLEAPQCVRRDNRLVICPVAGRYDLDQYVAATGAEGLPIPREYSSNENDLWLTVQEIKALVGEEGLT
jgi:FlaA1/EpsC-like NDP-sugar epimerase